MMASVWCGWNLGLDLAAQVGQRGAGGVGHFFRRDDAVRNLALQHRLRRQNRGAESSVGVMSCSLRPYHWLRPASAQRGGNFSNSPIEGCRAFGRPGDPRRTSETGRSRGLPFLINQAVDGVGLLRAWRSSSRVSQGCRSCIISLGPGRRKAARHGLGPCPVQCFLYAVCM